MNQIKKKNVLNKQFVHVLTKIQFETIFQKLRQQILHTIRFSCMQDLGMHAAVIYHGAY